MPKYVFMVKRVTDWEVSVIADNADEARIEFDRMIDEDFGRPVHNEFFIETTEDGTDV